MKNCCSRDANKAEGLDSGNLPLGKVLGMLRSHSQPLPFLSSNIACNPEILHCSSTHSIPWLAQYEHEHVHYRAPRLYATDHMEFLPIFRRLSSQFSSYDYNYIGICQTHKHSNKYHLNLGHASALIREFIRITGNKSLGNHASSYWIPL